MENVEPLPSALATVDVTSAPDGAATVRIAGELDMSSVDRLEAEVGRVLADGPPRLVVDVGDVSFADSSAIAMWVRWAGAVPDFELRDPSPLLRRVIRTMGLGDKLGVAT
jgi:anti-sigma B factor antagonist